MTQITTYKRDISFLDADRKKATIQVEITGRNGYPEFTMCGEYSGSLGQCIDSIKPATKEQKKLVALWKKWHLNSEIKKLPNDFENTVDELLDLIQEHEDERAGKPLFETLEDWEVVSLIEEKTLFEGRDAELCAALCKIFDLTENDLQDIEIDGNRSTVQGNDYLAGTDEEMDEEWDADLENYIDDCLEIPKNIEQYFDREAWKEDAKMDGRGHSLNRYNGGEESATINNTEYFVYRQ